jgi:hypothetical protein
MPLPELNTSGVDVGNTLMKIRAMENQDNALARQARQDTVTNYLHGLQAQNLQSEISARGTPEEQTQARVAKNALAVLQQKEAESKLKTENVKDLTRGINWIKEHPEPEKAYQTFHDTVTSEYEKSGGKVGVNPMMFPSTDYFVKRNLDPETGVERTEWDKKAYDKFATNAMLAANMSLHPIEGKTWELVIKTPPQGVKDETGNVITPDISKYSKVHMGVKDGQIVMLGAGAAEDMTNKNLKNETFLDKKGNPVVLNLNDPADKKRVADERLVPYSKPKEGEKLTMTDVKAGYQMDVSGIKNRMLIDMTPEEQQTFSGQPTENILAMLLAGKGKSLSADKKQTYIKELRDAETYYGNLQNEVLGRKGVKAPKTEKPAITTSTPPGGMKVQSDGTNITMNGKTYPIAADGTVDIDGKKYKVQ